MSVRIAYLVAAAINAFIAFLLPPHYWPVNALMVLGLMVLAWSDRRPHVDRQLYILLGGVTVATLVGSVAAEKGDAMIYTFLGLCLVVGFAETMSTQGPADS